MSFSKSYYPFIHTVFLLIVLSCHLSLQAQTIKQRFKITPYESPFLNDLTHIKSYYLNGRYISLCQTTEHAVLVKTDENFDIEWAKTIHSESSDIQAKDALILEDGSIWIVLNRVDESNSYLLKFSSDGHLLFEVRFENNSLVAIEPSTHNSLYCVFNTEDQNTLSKGIEVWSMDHNGVVSRKLSIKNTFEEIFQTATINRNKELILHCIVKDNNEDYRIITMLTNDLNIRWSKKYSSSSLPMSIQSASISERDGFSYVFEQRSTNMLLFKLDSIGNIIWSKAIGSSYEEVVPKNSIHVNKDNRIILNFLEFNQTDFAPLLIEFDTSGNFLNSFLLDEYSGTDGIFVREEKNFGLFEGHKGKTIFSGIFNYLNIDPVVGYGMFYSEILDISEICNRKNHSIFSLEIEMLSSNVIGTIVNTDFNADVINKTSFFYTAVLNKKPPVIACEKEFHLYTDSNHKRICAGTSTTLTASGASSYKWTRKDEPEILGDSPSLLVAPDSTTTYQVEGDVFMKKEITVEVIDPQVCLVQNLEAIEIISPNGDGINDTFYVENLELFPNNSIRIWNKWGTVVATKENYNNEGIDLNGLPEGTYFYQVTVPDFNFSVKKSLLIVK